MSSLYCLLFKSNPNFFFLHWFFLCVDSSLSSDTSLFSIFFFFVFPHFFTLFALLHFFPHFSLFALFYLGSLFACSIIVSNGWWDVVFFVKMERVSFFFFLLCIVLDYFFLFPSLFPLLYFAVLEFFFFFSPSFPVLDVPSTTFWFFVICFGYLDIVLDLKMLIVEEDIIFTMLVGQSFLWFTRLLFFFFFFFFFFLCVRNMEILLWSIFIAIYVLIWI